MQAAIREMVRRFAGVPNTAVPVTVVDGEGHAPILFGEPGGWHTKGGATIAYPSAYAKVGWSNMEYWTDAQYIYVGSRWIEKQILKAVRAI